MFDQNHKIKNNNNQMVIAAIYLEKSISLTGLECGDWGICFVVIFSAKIFSSHYEFLRTMKVVMAPLSGNNV